MASHWGWIFCGGCVASLTAYLAFCALRHFHSRSRVQGYVGSLNKRGKPQTQQVFREGDAFTLFLSTGRPRTQTLHLLDQQDRVVDYFTVSLDSQKLRSESPWSAGFQFSPSIELKVKWPPGFYRIQEAPHIYFSVVSDEPADIVMLLPTNTINAYTSSGGRGGYTRPSYSHLSFLRPQDGSSCQEWLACLSFVFETFPQARINVITDWEMEDPAHLKKAKLLFILGHSEYWTRPAVQQLEAFRDRGGNLIVMGGNLMWWQVRYERDKNRMVLYRIAEWDSTQSPDQVSVEFRSPLINHPPHKVLGSSFSYGGYGYYRYAKKLLSRDTYRVLKPDSPLFKGLNLKFNDPIQSAFVQEADGIPILGFDEQGHPVPDQAIMACEKVEIVAYGWAYLNEHGVKGYNLVPLSLSRKRQGSGTTLHFGVWHSSGMYAFCYRDAAIFKGIVKNAVDAMLRGADLFTEGPAPKVVSLLPSPFSDHTTVKRIESLKFSKTRFVSLLWAQLSVEVKVFGLKKGAGRFLDWWDRRKFGFNGKSESFS